MTITNKPDHSEQIAIVRTNDLNEKEIVPTAVFSRFLDELQDTINANELNINNSSSGVVLDSRMCEIILRLGSGIPATMDTTGLTMDSTQWTMDKTEQ